MKYCARRFLLCGFNSRSLRYILPAISSCSEHVWVAVCPEDSRISFSDLNRLMFVHRRQGDSIRTKSCKCQYLSCLIKRLQTFPRFSGRYVYYLCSSLEWKVLKRGVSIRAVFWLTLNFLNSMIFAHSRCVFYKIHHDLVFFNLCLGLMQASTYISLWADFGEKWAFCGIEVECRKIRIVRRDRPSDRFLGHY